MRAEEVTMLNYWSRYRHALCIRARVICAWTLLVTLGLLGGLVTAYPAVAASASDDDAAWAAVRAQVPETVPIYRPTYLPARLQTPARVGRDAGLVTPTGIAYGTVANGDSVAFIIGPTNGPPTSATEPIAVHGFSGSLITAGDPRPLLEVTWSEAGEHYTVERLGVSAATNSSGSSMG